MAAESVSRALSWTRGCAPKVWRQTDSRSARKYPGQSCPLPHGCPPPARSSCLTKFRQLTADGLWTPCRYLRNQFIEGAKHGNTLPLAQTSQAVMEFHDGFSDDFAFRHSKPFGRLPPRLNCGRGQRKRHLRSCHTVTILSPYKGSSADSHYGDLPDTACDERSH